MAERLTGQADIFGNKYYQGSDGLFYQTDGVNHWETPETARIHAEEEERKEREFKRKIEEKVEQIVPPDGAAEQKNPAEEITNEFVEGTKYAAKMTLKTIGVISLFGILFAGKRTYDKAIKENPCDEEGARAKSRRTMLCGAGIVANFVLAFALAAVLYFMGISVPRGVSYVIQILHIYIFYGLIRVARGKTFLINPAGICRKIRGTRVPKIAYVGIELLVTALLTKPVLSFINSFTVEWAAQNMDANDSLVITLGLAMLAGSAAIAAVIGLLACRLVKTVTAK